MIIMILERELNNAGQLGHNRLAISILLDIAPDLAYII